MTKVKLCGLSRESDIAAVNKLRPDLVGFVFAKKSKRYVSPEQAEHLKSLLAPGILAAGVFVNIRAFQPPPKSAPLTAASLLRFGFAPFNFHLDSASLIMYADSG